MSGIFFEGRLRKYKEVEDAYSKFKIEITGRGKIPIILEIEKEINVRKVIISKN